MLLEYSPSVVLFPIFPYLVYTDYTLRVRPVPAFPPVSFTRLEVSSISLTILYPLLIVPSSLSSLVSSAPLNRTLTHAC